MSQAMTNLNGVAHRECAQSRRDFLCRAGGGFGSLALWALLHREATSARVAVPAHPTFINPLAAQPPQFEAKPKSVSWCFMDGGPSHLDLFRPKPTLNRLAGQPLPASFPRRMTAMGKTAFTPLMVSQRKFARHGQSGIWVS